MQHIKGLQIGTYLINALLPQKDKKKNEKKKMFWSTGVLRKLKEDRIFFKINK